MRLMSWWATALAVAIVVAALTAQEKPNFSGEWTNTMSGGPSGFCGQRCTITQDPTSLTLTRMARSGQHEKLTFKLDGSESRSAGQGPQGRPVELVFRARWDDNKLRIALVSQDGNDRPETIVFSMNAGQMEVETSGTQTPPTKQTYKKN